MSAEPQMRQVAALPWRRYRGRVHVLLITSRETRRWVIPKGWAMAGLPDHGAAAREAFEEAGVEGITAPSPMGVFHYSKRVKTGALRHIRATVYPLEVIRILSNWPERAERKRQWFVAAEAAGLVNEPELAVLVKAIAESRCDR